MEDHDATASRSFFSTLVDGPLPFVKFANFSITFIFSFKVSVVLRNSSFVPIKKVQLYGPPFSALYAFDIVYMDDLRSCPASSFQHSYFSPYVVSILPRFSSQGQVIFAVREPGLIPRQWGEIYYPLVP